MLDSINSRSLRRLLIGLYHRKGPGRKPYSPLSMFKAQLLKHLLRIPSDRRLALRLKHDRKAARACGFRRRRRRTPGHSATYAARMNIQLLKAAAFNEKLRERGCSGKVSVQKICRAARNEEEVREALEAIWKNPDRSEEILADIIEKNKEVYDFEKRLEEMK